MPQAIFILLTDNGLPVLKSSSQGTVSYLTNGGIPQPVAYLASLTTDSNGNLYAGDTARSRIFEFPSATSCTASALPRIPVGGPVNAASYAYGFVAPGELIAIFGTLVGPSEPVGLTLDSSGMVSTNVGQTQVLFDGIPAPMVYASAGQTIIHQALLAPLLGRQLLLIYAPAPKRSTRPPSAIARLPPEGVAASPPGKP